MDERERQIRKRVARERTVLAALGVTDPETEEAAWLLAELQRWRLAHAALLLHTSDVETALSDTRIALERSAAPPGHRLILVDEDILPVWTLRTEDGRRLTAEWREPSPEGWYKPTFTATDDGHRLIGPEAVERAVRSALILQGWFLTPMDDDAEPMGADPVGRLADAIEAALGGSE